MVIVDEVNKYVNAGAEIAEALRSCLFGYSNAQPASCRRQCAGTL